MSEALREMTYDEQVANFIINILAIETPFSVKCDLISHLLGLTYRHERDIKDALYTPTEPCINCVSDTEVESNAKPTEYFPKRPPKPITNADRIRNMTDEEMAEWVWGAETAGRAYGPRGKKAWLDWLKEEAT